MTSDDVVLDRDLLRRAAVARLRRARRVATGVALSIFLIVVVVAFLMSDDDSWSVSDVAVLLVPTVVGSLLLLLIFRLLRRQEDNPQLLFGADKADRAAVQRALRAGSTTDPRIDALARDTARHAVRRPWLLWWLVGLIVLSTALLVVRVIDGDTWREIGLSGLNSALFTAVAARLVMDRRRAQRFLQRPAPTTSQPDVMKRLLLIGLLTLVVPGLLLFALRNTDSLWAMAGAGAGAVGFTLVVVAGLRSTR
ncbi:hypothetical protein [Actinoplanes sp. NPDC051859]|uniref:hypothetical protein n=1 Tax=Actinoplanes sp. NPDC051859 TaxID=3363909 RepID=UPI0037A55D15